MKKLSITQLKNFNNNLTNEQRGSFIITYAQMLADFRDESLNERETYFFYKNHFFKVVRQNGEFSGFGWFTNTPENVSLIEAYKNSPKNLLK